METAEDRWLARVKIPSDPFECWIWTGPGLRGYGQMWVGKGKDKKKLYTHRMAYEFFNKPIPAGMSVLHTCNNGHLSCVNPWHLYLGTQQDNMKDKVLSGRQLQGSACGKAKLSDEQVLAIRADSRKQSVIAREYKISQSQISAIKLRKFWSHLA